MGVLDFDGVGGRLEFSTLAAALGNLPTGAYTMAALCKRDAMASTDAIGYLKSGASPGTTKAGMSPFSATQVSLDITSGCTFTVTTMTTAIRYGFVIGKAAGTTTPRLSVKDMTTPAAIAHVNGSTTVANQTAADNLEIGSWQDADPFGGHIGLVGFWSGNMSDTDRAALFTNSRTSDWWNSAHGTPVFLAELNVAAASVVDLAGNASGLSVTATVSLDAAETMASWNFDGTGAPPWPPPGSENAPGKLGLVRGNVF
jgi:hypothetical protein